jgi:hypothetical protein
MNIITAINLPKNALRNTSKENLVSAVTLLRGKIKSDQEAYELELSLIKAKLNEKEAELIKLKNQEINKAANQPSSKQPEFNKDTGSKKNKKKKRKEPIRAEKAQATAQNQFLTFLLSMHYSVVRIVTQI